MRATTINLDRIGKLGRKLLEVADFHSNYDAVLPLLEVFEKIIVEDNRRGVLNGLDRQGNPVVPVKYRTGVAVPIRARRGDRYGTIRGRAKPGVDENLTSSEYKRLTGPPLAPRRARSRIIQNLVTRHDKTARGWEAVGAWKDATNSSGQPLFPPHFKGRGRLPKRDMAGVRPQGRREAREATKLWARHYLRTVTGS